MARSDFTQAVSDDIRVQVSQNPEQAEVVLRALLEGDPTNVEVSQWYILSLGAQNKHEEALECSRKLFYHEPENDERFTTYLSALSLASSRGRNDLVEAEQQKFTESGIAHNKLKNAFSAFLDAREQHPESAL